MAKNRLAKSSARVRKTVEAGHAAAAPAVAPRIPTARQRYLAANIRIRADEALRETTPEWIVKIAAEGKDRFAR